MRNILIIVGLFGTLNVQAQSPQKDLYIILGDRAVMDYYFHQNPEAYSGDFFVYSLSNHIDRKTKKLEDNYTFFYDYPGYPNGASTFMMTHDKEVTRRTIPTSQLAGHDVLTVAQLGNMMRSLPESRNLSYFFYEHRKVYLILGSFDPEEHPTAQVVEVKMNDFIINRGGGFQMPKDFKFNFDE